VSLAIPSRSFLDLYVLASCCLRGGSVPEWTCLRLRQVLQAVAERHVGVRISDRRTIKSYGETIRGYGEAGSFSLHTPAVQHGYTARL
jgi:hypothetical protein